MRPGKVTARLMVGRIVAFCLRQALFNRERSEDDKGHGKDVPGDTVKIDNGNVGFA